jgi:hypothetical protein
MRTALLLGTALLVGAAKPGPAPLGEGDFAQLMNAAVAAASVPSEVQPLTSTICVQRELQPPMAASRAFTKAFEDSGRGALQPRTGDANADKSLIAAMSAKAAVAQQTSMPALPSKFVLFDKERPPECVISHSFGRGPNWKHDESIVVLNFARPVLVHGYAYIEEHEECAGLCGTTYLRIFRKLKDRWEQVARTVLSVS